MASSSCIYTILIHLSARLFAIGPTTSLFRPPNHPRRSFQAGDDFMQGWKYPVTAYAVDFKGIEVQASIGRDTDNLWILVGVYGYLNYL